MAINPEVKAFLESKRAEYRVVSHPKVFSTIDEARALGIDADEIAKTLVIHISHMKGDQALVVVPGGQKVSNKKIRQVFANKHARLATEDELARDFPQFELGAVPPLGDLFDLPMYIDRRLLEHGTILFNGGTHTDSVRMSVTDFLNLTNAEIVDVAEERLAA